MISEKEIRSTKIEWTEKTWNPVTGCSKISAGCANCYAETMAKNFQSSGQFFKYRNGFEVTLHNHSLTDPLSWGKRSLIFVCSMGDLFHNEVPFEFIDKVIRVIESTPHHTYQILTKRAERMAEYFATRLVPRNAWLGVTVEVANAKSRIDHLRKINAFTRFLSCEPLIEDLGTLNLQGINWVIVGGESVFSGYYKSRPMKKGWVLSIKEQTDKQGAAFFFKQWGNVGSDGVVRSKTANGKELDGKVYQAMPKPRR